MRSIPVSYTHLDVYKRQAGEVDRFIFGFEESYGYLAGPYVRDKDAIIGSMLICEMAAYYRSIGSSLKQRLEEIYAQYGRYLNKICLLYTSRCV